MGVVGALQTQSSKALNQTRVTLFRFQVLDRVAVEIAGDDRRLRTQERLVVVQRVRGVPDVQRDAAGILGPDREEGEGERTTNTYGQREAARNPSGPATGSTV